MYKYMSWLRGDWRSRDQLEIPICHQGAPFLVDFLSLRKETCMAGKTFTTPLTTPKPKIPLYVKVHMEFPFKGESYQSCLWLHQSRGGGGFNIRTRIGSSFVWNRACAVRTLRNKMATTVTRPCKNTRSRIFVQLLPPARPGYVSMCERHRDRAHPSLRDPRWRVSGKEEIDKVHGRCLRVQHSE